MKRFLFALGVWVLGGALARAAGATADADFQAITAALAAKAPLELTTGSAQFHWREQQANRLNDLCEQFMEKYPADPRRWEAALVMFSHPRIFVKSTDDALLDQQKPGTVIRGAVTYDTEGRTKRAEWLLALDAKCAAATDMSPELRKKYELGAISRHLATASSALTMKRPAEEAPLRAELDRVIATYPDEPETSKAFNSMVSFKKRQGTNPDDMVKFYETYAESPSAGVREIVQTGLMMKRAQDFPIDWKFTAADGREVDFAKLRGKVVLIDFWATWCHPCIEELPNVVAAYKKYHAAGFEVVGITLENAGVPPNATPEAAADKLATAKRKMLDFTAANGMPWPQFYDGTGWKNPYTTKYGIRGIPAMYLLDQEGKVATLDARGEKLEATIKRLLKL